VTEPPTALGAGAISIAALVADERICSVRVASSRPIQLTRLFVGRPAEEVPILAERLYALCGLAHGLAAMLAIAAARGETPRPSSRRAVAALCESVSETLRSSVAMAAEAGAPVPRPLRELLTSARELATAPNAACAETAALRERMASAAAALGLSEPEGTRAPPPRGSWFGELWREVEAGDQLAARAPDALGAEDDAAVLDGLRRSGEGFAGAPRIVGRTVETGAFARRWRETDLSRGAAPARLEARIIDLREGLRRLSRDDGEARGARAFAPGPREGFAAVETSRGDLYHWARLAADGRVADYGIVAPTEWNFHPAGPFVAALLGAKVARGGAQRTIARLAGLFDPCVVFRVEIEEAAHA
jgi:hypothetical protein